LCSKWFKFNCMNSLQMNLNCNYRMNLQDTECLKISARPRARSPRAKIARPTDANYNFHYALPCQDPKWLLFSTPRAGKIWLTLSGLAGSICGDEVFLALAESGLFREAFFINTRSSPSGVRAGVLSWWWNCELLININKLW